MSFNSIKQLDPGSPFGGKGADTWTKIAEHPNELDFNAEGIAEVQAGDRKLCIARFEDRLFACSHKCPHAAAPLAGGYIDTKGNIVCPLHRFKFSLETGRNVSGEGYFLKHWPVEVREDGVFVALEAPGGWWKIFG